MLWRGDHSVVWGPRHAFVVPRDTWWAAVFNDSPDSAVLTYIDIIAPAEWREGRVRMLDLDLDVVLFKDGQVRVEDEDEFEEHRVSLGYPEDLVAGARTACDAVLAAVRARSEPFGSAWRSWLETVR